MPAKAEKRLKRIRNTCPAKVQERMIRATREKMHLLDYPEVDWDTLECEFALLGSTGNEYETTFGRIPCCNCPDYRKGNTTCKHILFITTQVMGISPDDKLSYQMAYLGDELEEMYEQMEEQGNGAAFLAKKAARAAYQDSLATQMSKMSLRSTPDDSDYYNYGKLQGQPSERDRSTYRPFHWETYPYKRYH